MAWPSSPGLKPNGPGPEALWARHEYTTIDATMLPNKLAAIALSPQVRPCLIQRVRDYVRAALDRIHALIVELQGTALAGS